jgi:peptidyl-prolyl cis-trans isomerase D
MATLEKIRNRAGVLVAVVIGMALLAFILGDFLNSGGALFSNSQFEIAEIAGKSIPYQKYQKDLNDIMEINKFTSGKSSLDEQSVQRIQTQTWNQLVRDYVLEDEYDQLGINVSSKELWDMVQGENIHPIIKNLFTNPETGELNTVAVIRFLKSYDQDPTGQQKAYWLYIENQMIQERQFSKYTDLIKKGLYATNLEAKNELEFANKKVDFDFVSKNINTVADSLIEVKTNDLKDYYNNHQKDYKQTASRNIEYITFDVVPSAEDKEETEKWINNIKQDFTNTSNDQDFISLNSDVSFDNRFYKQDELPSEIKNVLFNESEGFIYGPYFQNDTYILAKLSEVKQLPDSVKARHILLQPKQNEDYSVLLAKADSLKSLLKTGANFATLAKENSTDKVANEKGGDLGWFRANQMVSPFSDSCFIANVGEYKLIATQYGLHIVQVTNKARKERKVKVALLGRKLEASTITYQNIYTEASKFAGNNHTYKEFNAAIEAEGLAKKIATDIKEDAQQLAGLENPRNLIRSIFETNKNELVMSQNNPIYNLGSKYLIGYVTEIKENGIAPFEQVKQQLIVQVKKEKKAEIIANEMTQVLQQDGTLNFLADKLNTEVKEATDITFRSYSVPNAGIEPKLVAVATSLEADKVSAPIKGNNSVFVIKVKSISVNENTNIDLQKLQTQTQLQNRANYEAFEALKEASNIVDKRAKFY